MPASPCALGANTGNAAYDLNASGQDEYIEYQSQKVQAVQVKGGILVVAGCIEAGIVVF